MIHWRQIVNATGTPNDGVRAYHHLVIVYIDSIHNLDTHPTCAYVCSESLLACISMHRSRHTFNS